MKYLHKRKQHWLLMAKMKHICDEIDRRTIMRFWVTVCPFKQQLLFLTMGLEAWEFSHEASLISFEIIQFLSAD